MIHVSYSSTTSSPYTASIAIQEVNNGVEMTSLQQLLTRRPTHVQRSSLLNGSTNVGGIRPFVLLLGFLRK